MLAQTYSFQHIGVEDGLSQSVVTSVTQDNTGVFWIGTMSGVTRYDGANYQVMMKAQGLAENWVTTSIRDRDGNIWFGHWGGGVSMYDAEIGKIRDLQLERFSGFKTINAILQDKKGDIWFGTNGSGVFKYEAGTNTIVSFSKNEGFHSNFIRTMTLDGHGNIWFGTNQGIVIYRTSKEIEDKGAFLLINKNDGLPSDKITSLCLIDDKTMAVGTKFDGMAFIKNINKLSGFEIEYLKKENGLPSNEITKIHYNGSDHLWIGTMNEGLARYDMKSKEIRQLSTRQGLNYFKVNVITRDRENNIWIGTDLGLNLFRGDEFVIYDEIDGIINNVVWSIAQDKQERIWLGTNEGLSRLEFTFDPVFGHSEKPKVKNYTTRNGLSNNVILSIYIARDGSLWCGTGFGGVSVFNPDNEQARVIDSVRGLASNTVFSVTGDGTGNIWAGTDKGASKISPDGKITNFTYDDGLGGDNIYKIFRDSKGAIWFASIGGFLSKYENGEFKRFDQVDELAQKFITSIAEDKEGNIWFGAYGNGIFAYDGTTFTNYTTENGLSSNSPYSMVTDEFDHLWIGTSQGIDKFSLKDKTFKNYRDKEGFMGIEPNPNAVCRDSKGNVWFGTIMGAVKFDLSEEKKNTVEPVTMVHGLKVDHELFAFPWNNEFDHDENHITFEYIGISLTNPEHVQYKYKLEGFDHDWSPVTHDKDVIYSNIPPGKYEFKVKASNNDGIWNEAPSGYAFVINPPFWQTWWFYTLCGIFLLVAFFTGDQIRVRKLIADKQRLERKVEERTQEIAMKNIELEKKNKDILDSIFYARRIQTALLPSPKKVRENLSNSFILFRPKDIVSGDFYWMEKIGDKILFAAADCTGHGVPGAFMSIIGHNGLNKAVLENDITEPGSVLDQLNAFVSNTLKQSGHEEVKDGMDISVCCLNMKTLELQYAGAFNPLYIVRKGEVIETKADRQPIGLFVNENPQKFTNHSLKLQKNDALYIFSDGFADQFGGPKGKKFRYKQFRELLLDAQDKEIQKQDEHLEKVIDEWRGEIDQIDDIVVIGVKVV